MTLSRGLIGHSAGKVQNFSGLVAVHCGLMRELGQLVNDSLHSIAVIIPAREPEPMLPQLVQDLCGAGFGLVLVVNDGSAPEADTIFESTARAGARVLRHTVNLGKGRALKTAFNCILAEYPEITTVVTADADGQHTLADIMRVAQQTQTCGTPVLGARAFSGDVPLRSRLGNTLTRYVFAAVSGAKLSDTQSGLRGLPRELLAPLMTLEGERYEFEMNMLAWLCRTGQRPVEVPIETVYIEGNRSSHFSPVRDSMRIYFVLVRFVFSSMFAAALDLLLFTATFALTHNLAVAVVTGRLSSVVNFTLNRRFVFRTHRALWRTLLEYYLLAAALALSSYAAISMLTQRRAWNVLASKVVVDGVLSVVSFSVQRTFIFRQRARS